MVLFKNRMIEVNIQNSSKNSRKFARLGGHNNTRFNDGLHEDIPIRHFVSHPFYNPNNRPNDIAIAYLEHDVEFSGNLIMMEIVKKE